MAVTGAVGAQGLLFRFFEVAFSSAFVHPAVSYASVARLVCVWPAAPGRAPLPVQTTHGQPAWPHLSVEPGLIELSFDLFDELFSVLHFISLLRLMIRKTS